MVGDFVCELNENELESCLSCYLSIDRLDEEFVRGKRIECRGYRLPAGWCYGSGRILDTDREEIVINNRKPVLKLVSNSQALRNELRNDYIAESTKKKSNLARKYLNGLYMTSENSDYKENVDGSDAAVNVKRKLSETGDDANGTDGTPDKVQRLSTEDDKAETEPTQDAKNEKVEPRRRKQKMSPEINPRKDEPLIEETLESITESEATPIIVKRKRGRPRKNNPDPPFNPTTPLKKKTYYTPVKKPVTNNTGEVKRKRGRPRKVVAFGFPTIVSEIKTISLPSDFWSGHVSVTSKRSQVCFTRIVQPIDDNIPVELDRSVKFNDSLNYFVKINNRNVELLAAPKEIKSIKDVEILLQIVNDINTTDNAVLRYMNINNVAKNSR